MADILNSVYMNITSFLDVRRCIHGSSCVRLIGFIQAQFNMGIDTERCERLEANGAVDSSSSIHHDLEDYAPAMGSNPDMHHTLSRVSLLVRLT